MKIGIMLSLIVASMVLNLPAANAEQTAVVPYEETWVAKGRVAIKDAHDTVMRLLNDAGEQQNLRDMQAGLLLEERVRHTDAYFEHAVTIESYLEALKLDPDSPTFWASARCINLSVDASRLKDDLRGEQKRGAYRGYDVVLADLDQALQFVLDECMRVNNAVQPQPQGATQTRHPQAAAGPSMSQGRGGILGLLGQALNNPQQAPAQSQNQTGQPKQGINLMPDPVTPNGTNTADPVLSESAAESLLVQTIKHDGLYKSWTTMSCLAFQTEATTPSYFDFAIREVHGGTCKGDPATEPVVDRFRVARDTKQIRWFDVVNADFVSYDPARIMGHPKSGSTATLN